MDDRSLASKTVSGDGRRRVPVIAEALGYAGGALALAALVLLMTMSWDDLGLIGRVGIPALVAAVGLVGGLTVERSEEPAAKRLARFLLALGIVGAGCAAGFLVNDIGPDLGLPEYAESGGDVGDWAWFLGMLSIAVGGGIVWFRRRTWIQHLVFGAGVGVSSLLLLPLVPIEGHDWGAGAVLTLVGLVWGVLAYRGSLEPDDAGLLLASIGVIGGIEMMATLGASPQEDFASWAIWLGIAVTFASVVLGAWSRRFVVLATAVAGLVLFMIELVTGVLDIGMLLPIGLYVVGLGLLATSTYLTRRFTGDAEDSRSIIAEIGGYAGGAFLIAGTITMLNMYWDELNSVGRVLSPTLGSVVAYVTGFMIGAGERKSSRRLAQALMSLGAVGAAAAVGIAVYPVALDKFGAPRWNDPEFTYLPERDPGNWAMVSGALAAVVAGAITWWRRRGPAVVVVTGVACYMSVMTGLEITRAAGTPYWAAGAILSVIGLMWATLGVMGRLRPADTVLAAGSVLLILGVFMLQFDGRGNSQGWASILGVALAVAAIAASIPLRRALLLGFGAAAMVIFSVTLVQHYFGGEERSAIILLVAGVMLIAMAGLVVYLLPRMKRGRAGDADS